MYTNNTAMGFTILNFCRVFFQTLYDDAIDIRINPLASWGPFY